MPIVKQTTLNRHANASGFLNGLGCPLVTSTGSNVIIDGHVELTFGSQQTYIAVDGGASTQVSRIADYQNTYGLAIFSDTLFYWQEWDSSNRRGVVMYEKIEDKGYYGYVGNGTNWSSYHSFYDLADIPIYGLDGENLSRTARLNYPTELGLIDYAISALSSGGNRKVNDPNFLACSTVTPYTVITFEGNNYTCVGSHTLALMEEE